jgi:hypothetical protein
VLCVWKFFEEAATRITETYPQKNSLELGHHHFLVEINHQPLKSQKSASGGESEPMGQLCIFTDKSSPFCKADNFMFLFAERGSFFPFRFARRAQ